VTHGPRADAVADPGVLHEGRGARPDDDDRAGPAAVRLADGDRIAQAPIDVPLSVEADRVPVEHGQGAGRLERLEHVSGARREVPRLARANARGDERVLDPARGRCPAVERVFTLDGVPQPVEVERVAAAHAAPRIDELGARHLAEKAAPRPPVLAGKEREEVRRAHRDADREVEGAEALLEEDVEHPGREDAAHGAALDDEPDLATVGRGLRAGVVGGSSRHGSVLTRALAGVNARTTTVPGTRWRTRTMAPPPASDRTTKPSPSRSRRSRSRRPAAVTPSGREVSRSVSVASPSNVL